MHKGSVIDYLISNIDGLIMLNSFIVHKFSPLLSDVHCAISFTCKILLNRQQAFGVQDKHKNGNNKKKAEFVNNVNRQKVNELNGQLKTLKRSQCTKIQLENIVTCVNSAKISFKGRPVVSKKIKHSMPWIGLQCRKAQRKYYLAKRNNLTQRNEASKRKLTKSCKKYKSTVKNYHQKYIKTLQDKIRKTRVENPKRYWKMINSIDKKHDEIPIEMNVIFDYFKELNSNNNDLEISQTSRINSNTRNRDTIDNVHILVNDETIASSSALNEFITETEIDSTIKTLKSDKSCGCDEIVNVYITSTKHFMLPIYTSLFNIILDSGNIPSDWTRGIILIIYKNKGSKRDLLTIDL